MILPKNGGKMGMWGIRSVLNSSSYRRRNQIIILFMNWIIREPMYSNVILKNLIRRIHNRMYTCKNGENKNQEKLYFGKKTE